MQVQRHHNLVLAYVPEGENAAELYRIPEVTEIIRYNQDSSVYISVRSTPNPVICPYFDLDFMRITYRRCYVWFTKYEYKGERGVACEAMPIPIDEMLYSRDQVTFNM